MDTVALEADSTISVERCCLWLPEVNITFLYVSFATPAYYRWCERAAEGQLTDRVVVPRRQAIPPTPEEIGIVLDYAHEYPLLGYKRLAYALMAEKCVFLRPWMMYSILDEADLLGRRAPAPEPLARPPEADHPDQRWHTDLMMWRFGGQWFWLIDVSVNFHPLFSHFVMGKTIPSACTCQKYRRCHLKRNRWSLPVHLELGLHLPS